MSCSACSAAATYPVVGATTLGGSFSSYTDALATTTFGSAGIYPTIGGSFLSSSYPVIGAGLLSSSVPFLSSIEGASYISGSTFGSSVPLYPTSTAAPIFPTLPYSSSLTLGNIASSGFSYLASAPALATVTGTTSIPAPVPLALPAPVTTVGGCTSIPLPAPLALPAPPQTITVSSCCPPPPPPVVIKEKCNVDCDPRYTSCQRELEELRQRNCRLENRLFQDDPRNAQIQKLEAELARFRMQAIADKQRAAQEEASRQEWTRQVTTLQDQLRASENRIATMEAQWNAQRQTMQEQMAALQQRVQAAESQREGAMKQVAHLEGQVKTYETRITQMQQQLATLDAQRAEALKQAQYWEAQFKELQANFAGAQQKIAQLTAELQQIGALKQQVATLEAQRAEAAKQAQYWESQYRELEARFRACQEHNAQLQARIRELELEIRNLMARLEAKTQVHSQTSVKETYKVKSFEIAAKLAKSDGTDDGMYNGLPIEVEGEGLYRDLVAKGRKSKDTSGGSFTTKVSGGGSTTTTTETYKVQNYEMAEKLSKMDGRDDGKYNGLPIEVVGLGLFSELRRSGKYSSAGAAKAAGGSSSQVTGGNTYIVTSIDIAERVSKMNPADDGTYNGLPIEVKGMGLYRDLRRRKL